MNNSFEDKFLIVLFEKLTTSLIIFSKLIFLLFQNIKPGNKMSSIQTVLNSVDMRRKIFNFKSHNIKTTTQNNFNLVIEELNKCFENLLDNTAEMNEG